MKTTQSIQIRKPFGFSLSLLLRQEILLVILLVIAVIINSRLSPYFLDTKNLFDTTVNFMEEGLVALTMMLIIITGDIDLSVESNMAMSTIVMGTLFMAGMNVWVAVVIAILIGGLGGLVNGLIITRLRLPALIVTLGTMALYRGIAMMMTGVNTVRGFTDLSFLGQGYIPGTPIPISFVIFAVMAVIFGFLLHRTSFGRYVYAIGNNQDAARFSGIAVNRIKVILFVMSGMMSAFAGIIMASRFGATARNDLALGVNFEVVTAVVLGGVNILGGSGSVVGVVLGLFMIGMTKFGMSLVNVPPRVQTMVIGSILILAILLPNIIRWVASTVQKRSQTKEVAGSK
jgi:rhamnose transport system permease protein